jgi:hypothetical protein
VRAHPVLADLKWGRKPEGVSRWYDGSFLDDVKLFCVFGTLRDEEPLLCNNRADWARATPVTTPEANCGVTAPLRAHPPCGVGYQIYPWTLLLT